MKKQSKTKEERMSEIQDRLVAGTLEIFQSGKYKEYISTMMRFPRYSLNNCILIASQLPTASLVCGYKQWQKDFNRNVMKNAHGIMILAPMKFKTSVDEPKYDENEHPVLDKDGKQVTEKVTKEVSSFRPVYVFDVSATEGDPLPSLATMLDVEVDGYDMLKEAVVEISPVPIFFENFDGQANGFYSPSEQKIVVKDNMPELQTIKTMLHEIGHATLKHGSKEDKWDRETHEVQAESIAFWCASLLGLDTSDYSFGYISGWSKDKEVTELKENLDLIKTTADKISSDLEQELAKIKGAQKEVQQEVVEQSQQSGSRRKRSR